MRDTAQAPLGPGTGGVPVINEHVGERLKMFWPEEGGWFDAIISDYNAVTDEHCLTYHINTPEETFEWVHLKARPRARRPHAQQHTRARRPLLVVWRVALRALTSARASRSAAHARLRT